MVKTYDWRGKNCPECGVSLNEHNHISKYKRGNYRCKKCQAKYQREYRKRYVERHGATRGEIAYWESKLKIFKRLGGKCVECGFDDYRALQIDHINGKGSKERKKIGVWSFLNKLLTISDEELKSNYQLLCANHNNIKRYENKEIPVRREFIEKLVSGKL